MKERIHEIATKYCPDFPDIENQKPMMQLWAIESALEGTKRANEDCHRFIKFLRIKLNLSADQAVKEWEKAMNEKS